MRLDVGGQWAANAWLTGVALAGLVSAVTPAAAVDWDGDFPNDGNHGGEYVDDKNWATDVQPLSNEDVVFDIADTYTVNINKEDVTANSTTVLDGQITFTSDFIAGGAGWDPGTVDISGGSTQVLFQGLDFNTVANNQSMTIDGGANAFFLNSSVGVGSFLFGLDGNAGTLSIDQTEFTVDGSTGSLVGGFSVQGSVANPAVANIGGGSIIESQGFSLGNVTGSRAQLTLGGGSTFTTDGLAVGNILGDGDGVLLVTGSTTELRVTSGNATAVGQLLGALTGADLIAVSSRATADFCGSFNLYETGSLDNTGGDITIDGFFNGFGSFFQDNSTNASGSTTTFNGQVGFVDSSNFTVAGGTVNFNGVTNFTANAGFTHSDGTIAFNGETTLNQTELLAARSWSVTNELDFARRLRFDGTSTKPGVLTVMGGEVSNFEMTTASDLAIGFNGHGELVLLNNGVVDIYDDVIFGQNAGSEGLATIIGSHLEVTRNGSGSNLFIGLSGEATVTAGGGATINVGNDLVIQSSNSGAGVDSLLAVGDGASASNTVPTTINVGDNLLVGPTATGGATGELLLGKNADVNVTGQTRIRAGGIFKAARNSSLTTTDLQTDLGSVVTFEGGEVVVDGGLGQFNHGPLVIGTVLTNDDTATVRAINGGVLRTVSDVELVGGGNRAGILAVNGLGSRFEHTVTTATTSVAIGGTMGTLSVTDGGSAELGQNLIVGDGVGSSGLVNVIGESAGISSLVQIGGGTSTADVLIGRNDSIGQLFVRDGGTFNTAGDLVLGQGTTSNLATAQVLSMGTGLVNISNISARSIEANGARSFVEAKDGGLIAASSNVTLTNGNLLLDGGILLTPQLVANTASNRVDLVNGGVLQVAQVTGDLTNESGILRPDIGTGLTTNLTNDLGITGEYIQQAGATLEIQLGGTTVGSQHDRVVADVVTLQAGTALDVQLINGFMPSLGDSFEIVLANGVFGTFGTIAGLNLGGGLVLDIDYGLDRITLEVIQALLAGDYNGNGTVDAADYTVWADNFGSTTLLDADGNGDGVVDAADYTIWADNFGASSAVSQGLVAIPEPGTLALFALGVPLFARRRSAA